MSTNKELIKRDLSVLWHPCTQMKDHESIPPIPIKRAQGVWLEDFDGNRYLDAISSWWVNLFGHANPTINAAVRAQLDQLEHVLLAGFTHQPVVELAERLVALTPEGLRRCFFADNGSSAVEVALKMSFHYWLNRGERGKTKFVTLANSYHGETLGALAVGDVALYKKTYQPLLMHAITAPSPDCFHREPGESCAQYATRTFRQLEQTLEREAQSICAVIVEPLVQCAGSMRMYDPVYLSLLRQACDRHGVHLIADEIAVGFGRTGTMFACEQAAVSPDFLCLSKGLSGGYLPLSVVLTTEDVYAAFYADFSSQKAFLHSHSYTGNPLGCVAALATLDIFERDDVISQNRQRALRLEQAVARFTDHPHVGEVRQRGMIAAVELVRHKAGRIFYLWQQRRGLQVYRYALQNGVLLRSLGDVIYFMSSYVIMPEQIDVMVEVAERGINIATQED